MEVEDNVDEAQSPPSKGSADSCILRDAYPPGTDNCLLGWWVEICQASGKFVLSSRYFSVADA